MAISFTPSQQQVIDLHGCNILVSAAAGSGKTAVLVERIVKEVCDAEHPVDIDRLLVVTFTNAAAAEMRERIAKGISERMEQDPDNEHLQRQATLLHNAQITTIDSFCLFLLRNHFHEIGLDPAFRIADEGEIKLLQQDVMQELMEQHHGEDAQNFHPCIEFFCPGGRESTLEQYILDLSRFAASFPWPEKWLKEQKRAYRAGETKELESTDWGQYMLSYMKQMIRGCAGKMGRVQKLCEEPDGPWMYGELVDKELEQLERIAQSDTLEELQLSIDRLSFGRLSSAKDEAVSASLRGLASELRSQVKKSIERLKDRYLCTPFVLSCSQADACEQPVSELIDLTLDFDRRMAEKKREKKIVDFSDVEHFALDILLQEEDGKPVASRVAREYRSHFAEILIDEYQDSNLVQEYLLKAVSGEEDGHFNRFMVGDVKQSIYRFRLARPELFMEKYHAYSETEGDERKILLSQNFRSREQVIDSVNRLFEGMMSKQVGKIAYDRDAALYVGAAYPESPDKRSELLVVEQPDKDSGINARQAEARAIAGRIREMMGSFQVTDKATGELRTVRFSDIVILLRTNSGWDEMFKKELEEQGIPAFIASRTGYFAAREVQELLQFLRVLDNPMQDIPLFGVMKSLFGGFTEEEIAWLRCGRRGESLYTSLKQYMNEHMQQEDALCVRVAEFLSRIEQYRAMTVYTPIRELLTRIILDFGYLDYVTALPAGGKRRANVEMLLTKASDFEQTSYFGLFHFVRYMEQLEKYDVDYGEADLQDENADVVRIMSIHKSKGLEFPVTFVSGLSKRFNLQDTTVGLVCDMDLGLGVDYVNPDTRVKNRTLRKNAISDKLKEETLSEELRVLYVALTRASEKLIMTASVPDLEKWESRLTTQQSTELDYMQFMESSSYLDFVTPLLWKAPVEIRRIPAEELVFDQAHEQMNLWDKRQKLSCAADYCDAVAKERLQEILHAGYGHENLRGLFTKTTVSELKIAAMADADEQAYHAFEERETENYIPDFRRDRVEISGTVRGTAYHRVMELLDYTAFLDCTEEKRRELLKEQLDCLLQKKRLKEEYRQAVSEGKILQFLATPLAERMGRAQKRGELYREQPFVLGIEATRLQKDADPQEKVLIQGIIDVFFVEEDGIVLLDYKTDSISSMEDLHKRYETQLEYYRQAITQTMGKPVKEMILYSFHLGCC